MIVGLWRGFPSHVEYLYRTNDKVRDFSPRDLFLFLQHL